MAYDHKGRANALDRALKMAKVFKKDTFDGIMKALSPLNERNFRTACANAGLANEEVDWLWNYLQHYDEQLRVNLADAAGSGW